MDDADPTVPDHLRPLLGAAAEDELESVTDHDWPADYDGRVSRRKAILEATDLVRHWTAGTASREEIGRLAKRAAEDQQPAEWHGPWPRTHAQAEALIAVAAVTYDLIELRAYALRETE